jgi:aerobic carbon-monoxide dehydrogenase medium subunit
MRSFELEQPESLAECLGLLDEHGDSAFVLAGGTTGVLALRQGRVRPAVVVDLSGVGELAGARADADGSVRVGAMVTAAELGRCPVVLGSFPVLAATARQLGSVAVRNAVTVGGNICAGMPAADYPATLAALGATLTIASARGTRQVTMPDFPICTNRSALGPTEIVTEIRLPGDSAGLWADLARISASPADYGALVIVAVCASMSRARNRWADVRVAVAGARDQPSRMHAAEQLLEDGEWDDSRIEQAARLSEAEATLSDVRASAAYRGRIAGVALTGILSKARQQWEPSQGGALPG